MKKLLNLKGAQSLSNEALKAINGGWAACVPKCPAGCYCDRDRVCKINGIPC